VTQWCDVPPGVVGGDDDADVEGVSFLTTTSSSSGSAGSSATDDGGFVAAAALASSAALARRSASDITRRGVKPAEPGDGGADPLSDDDVDVGWDENRVDVVLPPGVTGGVAAPRSANTGDFGDPGDSGDNTSALPSSNTILIDKDRQGQKSIKDRTRYW
jgi:hypothetical protein